MVPSSRAWESLSPAISDWIQDAVHTMGLHQMTPVQAATIPLFMTHKDVVVEAVTGSGKTLAFLVPIIERLLRLDDPIKKHHVGAIIVSPTRELALQIHGVLTTLLAFHGPSAAYLRNQDDEIDASKVEASPLEVPGLSGSALRVSPQVLVGGSTPTAEDLSHFLKHSPNLLISTPGRLLELLSSPHVHCPQSSFEALVLDEADRLLDLGFKDDLQKILARLPKQRRTGLFSATVSEAVDQIVRVGLRNPVKVVVKVKHASGAADQKTPASLQMCYILAAASHKLPALVKLLSLLEPTPNKSIIYLSTCAAVDYFQNILPEILPFRDGQSYDLVPLHGKHPSKVRQKNFTRFANALTPSILLTTDVAARGLDIHEVDLVIQIDPPTDPKVFLHRCGRAGRAGRKGLSVIFLQPGREEDYITFLKVRKTPISPLDIPGIVITDKESITATDKIRNVVLADRAIHDKAQRGFVSWVQAYSKHQTSSIFRVADLDWADLGNAWGLLKLPKMPELKLWDGDKTLGVKINMEEYTYKDSIREQARKQALEDFKASLRERTAENIDHTHKRRPTKRAWSQKLDQRDEREVRREKRNTRQERKKWENMTPAEQEKQKRLEMMIEDVKRRKIEEDAYEDFEGFD